MIRVFFLIQLQIRARTFPTSLVARYFIVFIRDKNILGYYINPKMEQTNWENTIAIRETWILSMICIAIGVAFSIRSLILLQFSHASKGLPYTRSLIIIVIIISTLVALESCVFYQVG